MPQGLLLYKCKMHQQLITNRFNIFTATSFFLAELTTCKRCNKRELASVHSLWPHKEVHFVLLVWLKDCIKCVETKRERSKKWAKSRHRVCVREKCAKHRYSVYYAVACDWRGNLPLKWPLFNWCKTMERIEPLGVPFEPIQLNCLSTLAPNTNKRLRKEI